MENSVPPSLSQFDAPQAVPEVVEVQEFKEKHGNYGGERTGVKTHVVKSTSLNH